MADKAPSSVVKVTLEQRTYELDISKLTGHERREAKRLLDTPTFSLVNLLEDEVGLYVLAYLAAKRVHGDSLSFDRVLDLTADQVTVDFSGDEGNDDPFGPSESKASGGKRPSAKPSTEGS